MVFRENPIDRLGYIKHRKRVEKGVNMANLDKSKVSGRKAHYAKEPQSRDEETGQFTYKYNEPLSKKAYATRLPVSVAEKLEQLGKERGEWMRKVLVEASKELEESK